MDKYDNRVKLDIFKNSTTYQNDYKRYEPTPRGKACPRSEPEKPLIVPRDPPYSDHETFVCWKKGSTVPFELFVKYNEITKGDLYAPFKMPTIPGDAAKTEVIKTRPRVYMSPAVSIDDVEEPEMRQLLCAHMYTTDWKKASEETAAVLKRNIKEVPNTTMELNNDPVSLKVDIAPPLPHNFRNKGLKWEDEQLRASVDPTKMFWLHKDPPVKCGACINPLEGIVSQETKDQIADLIRRDKLRLPHDVPIPGYAGYRPMLSQGVSLAKKDLPVAHPFLSVTQAITKRYDEDKRQENT